jgi:hypothetical protein
LLWLFIVINSEHAASIHLYVIYCLPERSSSCYCYSRIVSLRRKCKFFNQINMNYFANMFKNKNIFFYIPIPLLCWMDGATCASHCEIQLFFLLNEISLNEQQLLLMDCTCDTCLLKSIQQWNCLLCEIVQALWYN